jgi:hypothetical protein
MYFRTAAERVTVECLRERVKRRKGARMRLLYPHISAELPRIYILRSLTSALGSSTKFDVRNSNPAYNLAYLGIEKNGHLAYRLQASTLLK